MNNKIKISKIENKSPWYDIMAQETSKVAIEFV